MSTEDDESRESSPTLAPPSRTSSRGSFQSLSSRQTPGPANIIEFVDSQDPNVKSAIQRHTAYHSAAQRRDARLRSLRRGSQSRFLEWSRRPVSEPPTKTAISSSTTALSDPQETLSSLQSSSSSEIGEGLLNVPGVASAPHSRSNSPRVPLSTQEEGVLQACTWMFNQGTEPPYSSTMLTTIDLETRCNENEHSLLQDSMVASMRTDEASTQLLLAYCYAILTQQLHNTDNTTQQQESAQQYFGRGTNILWNRLRDPRHASSDANIQAVLLLVAYTSDFGSPSEVEIHAEALRTMVAERGGIAVIANRTLRAQLNNVQDSRTFHLTLGPDHECSAPRRFPDGFWHIPRRPSR